ncbi:CHAT domain-containing protein [Roseateles sp.]|uniref:CHAT domain-containing protein n=1 Tax=Roseateles sp. TaxID=1971397 RepID=UPI002F3E91C5
MYDKSMWPRTPTPDDAIVYVELFGEGVFTQQLSPFRGHFIADLMGADFRLLVAHCPADLQDLRVGPDERLLRRAQEHTQIRHFAMPLDRAAGFFETVDPQFIVCRYHPEHHQHVLALERRHGWPFLRLPLQELEFPTLKPHEHFKPTLRDVVVQYVVGVCRLIRDIAPDSPLVSGLSADLHELRWQRQDGPRPISRLHQSAYPNEALWSVAGVDVTLAEPTRNLPDEVVYGFLSAQAGDLLGRREAASRQAGVPPQFAIELILFFPNYFMELFLADEEMVAWSAVRHDRESRLRALLAHDVVAEVREFAPEYESNPFERPGLRLFCEILRDQESFLFRVPGIEPYRSLAAGEEGREYLQLATSEVAASTAKVAMLAASCAAPVLRFSPRLGTCMDALFEFVRAYGRLPNAVPPSSLYGPTGKRHPDQDDIAVAFNAFADAAAELIPQDYLALIAANQRLKLISDFPFEWIRPRTLPLVYTKQCSKIPATPGQVMTTVLGRRIYHTIELKDIASVRVISSFEAADPLSGRFCRELREYLALLHEEFGTQIDMVLEEVRVATAAEFMRALETTGGKIAVIDMHGGALGAEGALLIDGNPFTSVQFEHEIEMNRSQGLSLRLPSVVILSSCDTINPLSNGFSIASALLRAGATAVVGTLLPIDASRSASFIGKVLVETFSYLSEPRGDAQSWQNMIADQLCFSAASDWFGVCGQLFPRSYLDREDYLAAIGRVVSSRVGPPEGLEDRLIAALAEVFGVSEAQVHEGIRTHAPFVDAMNYVQLGFPENVQLVSAPRV